MKILVFDIETTGLPKDMKGDIKDSTNWPYIVQISWLVYDDAIKSIVSLHDHIIKLSDNKQIPIESTKIHGITNEKMLNEGVSINQILSGTTAANSSDFLKDFKDCQILVAHNIKFDINIIQAELFRNFKINPLQDHNKIEYCTMKYGKSITKIWKQSKYYDGLYLKPPRLSELHEKLFAMTPTNLHNSMVDVWACFRCFHHMIFGYDICDAKNNVDIANRYNRLCSESYSGL